MYSSVKLEMRKELYDSVTNTLIRGHLQHNLIVHKILHKNYFRGKQIQYANSDLVHIEFYVSG